MFDLFYPLARIFFFWLGKSFADGSSGYFKEGYNEGSGENYVTEYFPSKGRPGVIWHEK